MCGGLSTDSIRSILCYIALLAYVTLYCFQGQDQALSEDKSLLELVFCQHKFPISSAKARPLLCTARLLPQVARCAVAGQWL